MSSALPLALLQTTYGMTDGQFHWLIVSTALTALAVLIMACALGAIAFVVVKLVNQVLALTAELKGKIYPVLDNVKDVVNDSVPKVKRVTTNVADTSDVYRAKVAEVDALLTRTGDVYKAKLADVDILLTKTSDVYKAKLADVDTLLSDTASKARKQSDRVDGMVSDTLTSATNLVGRIENTVLYPVRQSGAIFSGIKAGAERLVQNFSAAPSSKPSRANSYNTGAKTTASPPKPVAFEGDSVYTGLEDDYHA